MTYSKVLYISYGCCTEFNTSYFILYLFFVINDYILNLMMLIQSGILLKNNVIVVIYAKILHLNFIPTICENFKSVFWLIYCKRKFENLYTGLIWEIKRIKAILRYFDNMDIISKKQNIVFAKNYYIAIAIKFLHGGHLQWNSYLKSLILNSCTLSIFPAL